MLVKRGNILFFIDIIVRLYVMFVKLLFEKFVKIVYILIWIKRKMFVYSVFFIEIDKMLEVNLFFYKFFFCKVGYFL